ncbi:hypothetical protein DV515_00006664 [Chloebia gouldiae]|uniref:Uncharacterized protein n=1 Tax=Chloebia gouldiae TaxID=44316 RepID=A0A3L8SKL6_CHLGU|nr:hypothetical protein DV515_00006664 [Chloebia gouldiae]
MDEPGLAQELVQMLHSPLRTGAKLSLQEPVRPRWLKEMHIPACSTPPVGPTCESFPLLLHFRLAP